MTRETLIKPGAGEVITIDPVGGAKVASAKVNARKSRVIVTMDGDYVEPTPEPTPTPTPTPSTGNILGVDVASRPRSGAAWDRVLTASKRLGPVTLTDTGGSNNGELLAAAFVAAGDATIRARVVSACSDALNGAHDRTLEQARNLAPIAIALSVIDEHSLDAALLRERDYVASSQGSVVTCHNKRPNNWGTAAGLARIAVDAHLGDADLAYAAATHRAWLTGTAASFVFDDSGLWQADPAAKIGINRKGTSRNGVSLDGILPDDQRRGGAFPNLVNENYVWQALGEVAGTQLILRASGYPDVFSWGDSAVKRAYQRYATAGYGCSGDDGWQYAFAAMLGVTIDHDGFAPGKSFGWVDFLYGSPS